MVILAGPIASPTIVDRRRIEIADPRIKGSKQPYHTAEEQPLDKAETLVNTCIESSTLLAKGAVQAAIAEAAQQGYQIAAAGILTGSGKPIPPLDKILASHPLLHTAEGELFRNIIIGACESCGLSVRTVQEKVLLAQCPADLGIAATAVQQHLAQMGKAIGSPWRQDQKFATLIAWMALGSSAGGRDRGPRSPK